VIIFQRRTRRWLHVARRSRNVWRGRVPRRRRLVGLRRPGGIIPGSVASWSVSPWGIVPWGIVIARRRTNNRGRRWRVPMGRNLVWRNLVRRLRTILRRRAPWPRVLQRVVSPWRIPPQRILRGYILGMHRRRRKRRLRSRRRKRRLPNYLRPSGLLPDGLRRGRNEKRRIVANSGLRARASHRSIPIGTLRGWPEAIPNSSTGARGAGARSVVCAIGVGRRLRENSRRACQQAGDRQ